MPDTTDPEAPLPDDPGDEVRRIVEEQYTEHINNVLGEVPRPISWRSLPPEDLEHELLELNAWVDWLRHEYGLPAQIIPPMWHRHPELLWELSALRQHWLFCYDPQAKGNQALAWHTTSPLPANASATGSPSPAPASTETDPPASPPGPAARPKTGQSRTRRSNRSPSGRRTSLRSSRSRLQTGSETRRRSWKG